MNRLSRATIATGFTFSALAATAPPADAGSMWGCAWPYVCLYSGSYSSGFIMWSHSGTAYTNMPSSTQNQADAVVNTRNDDAVWLLDTGPSPDAYICVEANTAYNLGDFAHPTSGTWANDVDTIDIRPEAGCSVRQGRLPDGWRP